LRTTKTTSVAEKRSTKEKIRDIIKKPKEKFLTNAQEDYWDILDKNQITICFGPSGTGKSFIALKKAVQLLWEEDNKYEKLVIIRPSIETENHSIGSLPGTLDEKMDPYIFPSYYLLDKIIGKDSRILLKEKGIIEILSLNFIRGYNADNVIVIAEEFQNSTPEQMKLLLTRIGYNSKIFISGDIEQSDRFKDKSKSGLFDAKEKLKEVKDIGIFEFSVMDIVRNPLITLILERYS
jgi:phosphate starvation-inducible PhoH-like protein